MQINGDRNPWRRNPYQPARRVADLIPRKMSEQDRWRAIVRNTSECIASVKVNQDTMRLAMVIPSWTSFIQTSYYREMAMHLDNRMLAKYRAWWNLLLDLHPLKKYGRAVPAYALGVLLAAKVTQCGGPPQKVREERFRLDPETAGLIREAVLSRLDDLTAS